jgi:RNA polymerase sigma factor (sigma-70 family)
MNGVLRDLREFVRRQEGGERTDGQLLERFLTHRDEAAFTALVRRHGGMVLGVCRRVLGNAHDAEDAFQATFFVLARKAADIAPRDAVGAWLYGVAYRTARRAQAMTARRRLKEQQVRETRRTATAPEEDWEEVQPLLDEELSHLPPKYQSVIVLCDLEGKTKKEAAAQLRCPEGTLSSRLTRGRRLLAKRLALRGVTLPAGTLAAVLSQGATPVHAELVVSTGKAATRFAAGGQAAVVSATVVALTQGVLKAMLLSKLKFATAVLVSVIVAGVGLLAHPTTAVKAPEVKRVEGPVATAGRTGQPTPAEGGQRAGADHHGDPLPPGALARLGTGRLRHESNGWGGPVVFSPDGKTLISGGDDTKIRLWDRDTGKQVGVLQGPPSKDLARSITALAVSADGKLLASADANQTLRLWDLEKRRQVHSMVGTNARCLAFTPDGKTLISGGDGYDRSIRLWDVTTGKEQRRFLWHKREVSSLTCTPDGRTAISTDRYDWGKIYLIDLATGKDLRTRKYWSAPKGAWAGNPDALAVSPDGTTVAWGDSFQWEKPQRWEYRLRLLDLATGKELRRLIGHEKGTNTVAFSPDGKTLASASWDRTIRLWDVATGKELRKLTGTHSSTVRLAFAPDGKALASFGGDSTIHLWDVATGKQLHRREGHEGAVYSVAFSPDGRTVASCSIGDQPPVVRLWDAATGKPLPVLRGHETSVRSVAFLPDGKTLVSSSDDRTLRVREVATGKEVRRFQLPEKHQVSTMHLSADGKVLVAQSRSNERDKGEVLGSLWITVWDVPTGKQVSQRRGDPYAGGLLTFSPDGKYTAQQGGPHALVVREVATGMSLVTLPIRDISQYPYAFSPDGKTLAIPTRKVMREGNRVWYEECGVRLFELATSKERLHIPTAGVCRNLRFSPDGRFLAWAGDDALAVYDVDTGKELLRRPVEDGNVRALAFSPDSRKLATGLSNATVLIWDVAPKGKGPGR